MNTRRRRAGIRRSGPRTQRRRIAQYRLAGRRMSPGTKTGQGLFILGAVVTALYIVGVPWLYFGNLDLARWLDDIRALQLGEYGGVLVGTFVPLALLWLTLAVIKHGQELNMRAVQLATMLEHNKQLLEGAQRPNRHDID